MEIEEFREKTSWNARAIIAILLLVLAFVIYNTLTETIGEYPWLQVYCNVDMVRDFGAGNVISLEEAEGLAGSVMDVDNINASTMQYCGGYDIASGDRRYFLCTDGRLYELTSCRVIEQDQRIPLLPDPKDVLI